MLIAAADIRVGQISHILKTLKYMVSCDISNIIAKFQVK